MIWTETWEFDFDTSSRQTLLSQFYEKASEVALIRGINLEGVSNVEWRMSDGRCRMFGTVWLEDWNEAGEEE